MWAEGTLRTAAKSSRQQIFCFAASADARARGKMARSDPKKVGFQKPEVNTWPQILEPKLRTIKEPTEKFKLLIFIVFLKF